MLGNTLKQGDTIGIVAPASAEKKENVIKNIHLINELGFKVKLAKHAFDKTGYLAGEDTKRVKDLMDMFQDTTVNGIVCLRGGYGSMRLLPLINWEIIKSNPKIFVGFSDITCLLNQISRRCNLVTFHGPMLSSNLLDKHTTESLLHTLKDGFKPYNINCYDIHLRGYSNCITEGYTVGGNLSLICSTLGTPYEIDTTNKILFIEEVSECPYKIDRMLTQLTLANKLQKCRGFILGHFTNCSTNTPEDSLSLKEVMESRLLNLNKPTIVNFPSGHAYPNIVLPIGAKVRLNCAKGKIEVLEAVVNA